MARIDLPAGAGPEVTRALAVAPHFAPVVMAYEDAVAKSPLDPRLHELVRYRIAQLNQCTICLGYRRDDSGVGEDLLARVADWRTVDEFTAAEKAALDFTEQFCGDSAAISDELVGELERLLPPGHVVELALVVGKYVAMGRFMQVLGLDQSCDVGQLQAAATRR
jgi:alkylhydroperoxidase family enzyme